VGGLVARIVILTYRKWIQRPDTLHTC